ncbi:predicted protein [Uncinocarpus reesii 1704]|uniref:Uncharacterized protein n=1 Tax=Uncinocarpus reesii (strain UAMH 1704) TaxID=336963 RepID=C4JI26_UNCRE|nr:uncharacterized protein UREG_01451 [Uncinocarpus reesii 1704]EEP76602.1 predicted protein [Uncinocarpus reesii 1704]
MPTLKQLSCHVEWAPTDIPFKEYGVSYSDGIVESYIAIPSAPTPFSINLQSHGYIAPGLAMFVFMDGVYQCNRNRDDLIAAEDKAKAKGKGAKGLPASRTVNFRVRQKEEKRAEGRWVGRPWRFEPLNIIPEIPGMPEIGPKSHFDHLGEIMVIVLRCVPRNASTSGLSDGSRTPDSAMAPSPDPNDVDLALSDEEFEVIKAKYKHPEPEPELESKPEPPVEVKPEIDNKLTDFGMLFDGANDRYYAPRRHHRERHDHHAHENVPFTARHGPSRDYCVGCDHSHHPPQNDGRCYGSCQDAHARREPGNIAPSDSDGDCSSCAGYQNRTARLRTRQRHNEDRDWPDCHATRELSRDERGRPSSHSSTHNHLDRRESTRYKPHEKIVHELSPSSELTESECECAQCSHSKLKQRGFRHSRTASGASRGFNDEWYHTSHLAPESDCRVHHHGTALKAPFERSRSQKKRICSRSSCLECNKSAKHVELDVHHSGHLRQPEDPGEEHGTHYQNEHKTGERIAYGSRLQGGANGPSIVLNVNTPTCGSEQSTCKTCNKQPNDSDVAHTGCYVISDGKKIPHQCRRPRTQAPQLHTWGRSNRSITREASPARGNEPHVNQPSGCGHGSNAGNDPRDRNQMSNELELDKRSNQSRTGSIRGQQPPENWGEGNFGAQDHNNNEDIRSTGWAGDGWPSTKGDTGNNQGPLDWSNDNQDSNNTWPDDNQDGNNHSNGPNDDQWGTGNGESTNHEPQQGAWSNENSEDNGQHHGQGSWGHSEKNNSDGGNPGGDRMGLGQGYGNNNSDNVEASNAPASYSNEQANNKSVPQPQLEQTAQQPSWVPMQPYRLVTPNQQPAFVSQVYYDPQNDEPPLYTVPEAIAQRGSLSHQVQVGRAEDYLHKLRVPEYLDTMEEPYAKFIFKYRLQEIIERKFDVKVERDPEVERKKLEMLPKSEIVNQLLNAQGIFGNQTSTHPANAGQPDQPIPGSMQYGGAFGNSGNQNFPGYWPPGNNHMAPLPPAPPMDMPNLSSFSIDGASSNINGVPIPLHGILLYHDPSGGHFPAQILRSTPQINGQGHDKRPSVHPGSIKDGAGSGNNGRRPTNARGCAGGNGGNVEAEKGRSNGDPFQRHRSNDNSCTNSGDAFQSKHHQSSNRNVSSSSTGTGDPFQSRHTGGVDRNVSGPSSSRGGQFPSGHSGRNRGTSVSSSGGGSARVRNSNNRMQNGDPFQSRHGASANGSTSANPTWNTNDGDGDWKQNGGAATGVEW